MCAHHLFFLSCVTHVVLLRQMCLRKMSADNKSSICAKPRLCMCSVYVILEYHD